MIRFNKDTHEYFLDGKKLISVTQLMRKHGLAPNYDGIPSEVLRAKAERGTLIHKEIEKYINCGSIGFTTEFVNFKDYVTTNEVELIASETILYNDIVAGTADLILKDNGNVIADIKTTATLHKEAVSWQLSIYAELFNSQNPVIKVERGQAYHFDKDGALKVVEIPLKPSNEVKKLFDAERNGELYKQELTVRGNELERLAELESIIKGIEEQKKVAEAQAQELRAVLMAEMEKNGVTKFENDRIILTYVAPSTRTAIDSTRLKKELPEIAEQYTKTSNIKASLRITLKEAE